MCTVQFSQSYSTVYMYTLLKIVTHSIQEDAAVPTFLNRFSTITNDSNLLDINRLLPITTTIVTGTVQTPDLALAQDLTLDLLIPRTTLITKITTTINPLQLRNLQGLTAKAAMLRMRMPLPALPNNNL